MAKYKGKHTKKTEFSKKIFVGVSAVTTVVVGFTLAVVWRTGDTSPLAYLIPAIFAELATATGFYYHKARKENEIKLPRYLDSQKDDLAPGDCSASQEENTLG